MWDRKELKAKGKSAFQNNYWKCVVVALLMGLLLGGQLGFLGNRFRSVNLNLNNNQPAQQQDIGIIGGADGPTSITINGKPVEKYSDLPQEIRDALDQDGLLTPAVLVPVLVVIGGIVGTVLALGKLVDIFVINPLRVGCFCFFRKNSSGQAELNDIGAGFKDWGRCVKTMFFRDLFLILWSCLFVIPGIVKSYSYRLTPYILTDRPELEGTAAIDLSRKLMQGHKWKTFVLDLSFLGWSILSAFTAGLLGIFYVNPYREAVNAELYLALRGGSGEHREVVRW